MPECLEEYMQRQAWTANILSPSQLLIDVLFGSVRVLTSPFLLLLCLLV